jgi:hypothetical protein
MVAISKVITSSPILEKNLERPELLIMVKSPSVITEKPVFEMNRLLAGRELV